HPRSDVLGDGVIEALLHRRQLVLDGDRTPLREKSPAIEGQQAFLHVAAHQVGRFGNLVSDPGTSSETIRIEERQEELEVLVLAVVWRGSEQQEVAGQIPELLAQPEPLGLLDRKSTRLNSSHV